MSASDAIIGWPANAYVGQKVVCVEAWALGNEGYGDEIGPVEGQTYTIRDIYILPIRNILCFRLVEIVNPHHIYSDLVGESGFYVRRFRPAQTKSTDAAVAALKRLCQPEVVNV